MAAEIPTARPRSLDVTKNAQKQYPRQGANKPSGSRGKPQKARPPGAKSGTTKRGRRAGLTKTAKKAKRADGRKGGAR